MRFGVGAVDHALQGGPVLLRVMPGVEYRPFVAGAIRRHEELGAPILYVTTDKDARRIRGDHPAASIIDAHGPWPGDAPAGTVIEPDDILHLTRLLERHAREQPDAMLVIDAASSFALRVGPERFEAHWRRIHELLGRFAQALIVFVDWGTPLPPQIAALQDEVMVQGVEDRIVHNESVRVRGRTGPMMFHVRDGQVRLHVPKVVVTGPADAGKTTFVQTLCARAATTGHHGTTVAGDRGRANLGDVDVELFGTPGHERFDPLLPTLLGQAVGAVFVVDATDQERFQRARGMLQVLRAHTGHIIVMANKSDRAGAQPPEAIAVQLGLDDETPVLAGSANDPASARAIVQRLVDDILEVPS